MFTISAKKEKAVRNLDSTQIWGFNFSNLRVKRFLPKNKFLLRPKSPKFPHFIDALQNRRIFAKLDFHLWRQPRHEAGQWKEVLQLGGILLGHFLSGFATKNQMIPTWNYKQLVLNGCWLNKPLPIRIILQFKQWSNYNVCFRFKAHPISEKTVFC